MSGEFEITSKNVFSSGAEPDFELPEVAQDYLEDWTEDVDTDHVALLFGFASALWAVLDDDKKSRLSPYQRAALESFADTADDIGVSDEIANKL